MLNRRVAYLRNDLNSAPQLLLIESLTGLALLDAEEIRYVRPIYLPRLPIAVGGFG